MCALNIGTWWELQYLLASSRKFFSLSLSETENVITRNKSSWSTPFQSYEHLGALLYLLPCGPLPPRIDESDSECEKSGRQYREWRWGRTREPCQLSQLRRKSHYTQLLMHWAVVSPASQSSWNCFDKRTQATLLMWQLSNASVFLCFFTG